MTLYFVTGNKNKFAEAQAIMPQLQQITLDLEEIQSDDIKKIVAHKLAQVQTFPCIVEDTSIYIDALNGLPGPFIKWFLQALQPEGIAELVHKYDNHTATAKTVIGLAEKEGTIMFFEGQTKGTIVSPKGNYFGWSSIFQPEGHSKTYAELSMQERTQVNQRGKAFKKLAEHYENLHH